MQSRLSPIETLPNELLQHIFKFMPKLKGPLHTNSHFRTNALSVIEKNNKKLKKLEKFFALCLQENWDDWRPEYILILLNKIFSYISSPLFELQQAKAIMKLADLTYLLAKTMEHMASTYNIKYTVPNGTYERFNDEYTIIVKPNRVLIDQNHI